MHKLTDIENARNLFTSLNIDFTEKYHEVDTRKGKLGESYHYNATIALAEGIGYDGFSCEFYFMDGKSVAHAVWE